MTEPFDATAKAQRVRMRFARRAEAGDVGHVDLARAWERAFETAGLPISRSPGRRAQARITLAAGLPRSVTSDGELLDVILALPVRTDEIASRVKPYLPDGIELIDVTEAGMGLPSLPTAVRWADYELDIPVVEDVDGSISVFRVLGTLPWRDTRGEKVREYDIRPVVRDVRVERRCGDVVTLSMRLRCDTEGVGRPDQVVLAIGLPQPLRIHRKRLVLAETSPAHEAWRRKGRYAI